MSIVHEMVMGSRHRLIDTESGKESAIVDFEYPAVLSIHNDTFLGFTEYWDGYLDWRKIYKNMK